MHSHNVIHRDIKPNHIFLTVNRDIKIIDLGADYRFRDEGVYEQWYKVTHTHINSGAVYGLTELYRDQIKSAKIVGNAGCYTTASILALAPLAKTHLIDVKSMLLKE